MTDRSKASYAKRLLKEPLLHFLLLGALIFLGYSFKNGFSEPSGGEIVVTQGRIENLQASFSRIWQRPPSAEELDGLIRDYIREEVFLREAVALGLDKDDTVIRRRLRQKMEFISDDVAAPAAPGDAELNAYLKAHPEKFRIEPAVTFLQVYLNPQKHKENLERDQAELLTQLRRAGAGPNVDVSTFGDAFLLQAQFKSVPVSEIENQFGEKFAEEIQELPAGAWQGPLESGYGKHFVLIRERTEARAPELEEVREAVSRELDHDRRFEANENFYKELLKKYEVRVEKVK